jgi:hypothetical protein
MLIGFAILGVSAAAAPVRSAFTYQGQLKEGGAPASGLYDFEFRLFDLAAGGAQQGSAVPKNDVLVESGFITVDLDFSAGFDGNRRWLDVRVRGGASAGAFTPLTPRQELTGVPYAHYALGPWQTSGANILNTNTGNVGIGTSSPQHLLQIGDADIPGAEGMLRFESRSSTPNTFGNYMTGVWDIGAPRTAYSGPVVEHLYPFVIDNLQIGAGPEFFVDPISGNIGIGSQYASAQLTVRGEAQTVWIDSGTGTVSSGPYALVVSGQPAAYFGGDVAFGGNITSSLNVSGNIRSGGGDFILNGRGGGMGNNGGAGRALVDAGDGSHVGIPGLVINYGNDFGHVIIQGSVQIDGPLSKPAGSFKIDHPLDPQNKYLYHSFVESPDMKNIYDGVVALGADGTATVELPDWFEALNRNFRYQLTCIGEYAPVYIAEEVQHNRFRIAGGRPGLKVSWQVTGTRHDAYANAHRIPVEEDKPEQERGRRFADQTALRKGVKR